MDCFICHRSNWMQEKCLGFLRNLLENYKDMIEDADVFLPLECPGADELLVRLVREEIPQDVIERMSERSRRGFLLELDDDPVHTTLGGLWNAADTRSKVRNILPALFGHALASPWGGEGRKGHLPRQDDGIAAHLETVRQGNRHHACFHCHPGTHHLGSKKRQKARELLTQSVHDGEMSE